VPSSSQGLHNGAMETNLAAIKVALAVMSNAELDALIKATYKVEQIAPGLLAWLGSACVWQLQRRNGYHFELQPPEAAIPPEEDAVSIDAAIALRTTFAKESPAVGALFDALVELLSGGERNSKDANRDASV
jgi:hypothetical protein